MPFRTIRDSQSPDSAHGWVQCRLHQQAEVVLSVTTVSHVAALGVSSRKSAVAMGDAGEYSSGPDRHELEASLMRRRPDKGPLDEDQIWRTIAGISGIMAVGLGAFGTHMFKPVNPANKVVWETANLYHLVHSVALLAVPLTKRPRVFGSLLTFGLVAFSGSCYFAAYYENRSLSLPAPFGGFGFMGAWASLLF